jgi:hypothetical protein
VSSRCGTSSRVPPCAACSTHRTEVAGVHRHDPLCGLSAPPIPYRLETLKRLDASGVLCALGRYRYLTAPRRGSRSQWPGSARLERHVLSLRRLSFCDRLAGPSLPIDGAVPARVAVRQSARRATCELAFMNADRVFSVIMGLDREDAGISHRRG